MKRDVDARVEEARGAFEPAWDDARAEAVRAGMPLRRRRRVRRRVVVVGVAACVVALFVWGAGREAVQVEPLPHSRVARVERQAGFERWRISEGGARFDVRPGQGRRVTVRAGDFEVTVLGTRFLVALEGPRVRVAVERGVVRVTGPGVERLLGAGEEAWFSAVAQRAAEGVTEAEAVAGAHEAAQTPPDEVVEPASAERSPGEASGKASEKRPSRRRPHHRAGDDGETWQTLARSGDFARAWQTLQEAGPPRDEPAELLLAADVARLARHPSEAVAPLRRILTAHPRDARAPLAAFTLGRVLLDDLGRPREAAQAFAEAQRLAPQTSLAEDAWAREVEALFHAQSPDARRRAEAFEARYPKSARLRAVRRFGGLE